MSYSAFENSPDEGQIASLFLITWGDGPTAYDAYTDADVAITYNSVTYQPIAIAREKVESSGTLDRKQLQVDIDPSAEIVARFRTPPSQKVAMTIRQGHVDDSEFVVCWTGIVKNVVREGSVARIVAEPLDSWLARPGLRRRYSRGCPHVLYASNSCRADADALKLTVSPSAIGSNYVTLGSTWNAGGAAKTKYLGGYMQWTDADGNTQTRGIIAFGGNQNELVIGNTVNMTLASSLSIYAGCNHQLSDCRDLHANVENFGGMPFIPMENPVGFAKNHYY